MIVVMKMGAAAQEVEGVLGRIRFLGYRPHLSSGEERVIIGVIGNDRPLALTHNLGGYPGEMVSFVSILATEPGTG